MARRSEDGGLGLDALGRVEAPLRVGELASRSWDVVVVGAGHNGLAAAAYLARAGLDVLVLERRDRVGGACSLEEPFPEAGWRVSPCAYLVGLLHPLVVEELDLHKRGYVVHLVDPHLWCPFEDGTSLDVWDDPHRSAASVARISPSDVEGYLRYCDLFGRIRRALREGPRDTWIGEAPNRADLEELLGADAEAKEVLFEASIADVVERHVRDERLRTALHGQGIIGTFAGPRDAGTASIHLMHASGALEGKPGAWGYVEGGMGRVSVALASAALDAGAVIATDVEVAAIAAGEGVRLGGGEFVKAPVVVSNADPKTTAALFEGELPEAFSEKVRRWSSDGCVVKLNCGLARLPSFLAEVASGVMPHRAMVTVSSGIDATQSACEDARSGRPAPAWCELYFQTAYDASVAPAGRHQMSVFAQYVPYRLDGGGWDARREEIGDMVLAEIARFAPDVEDCVIWRQVLGPPDTEARIGLAGGHIFQGECLPGQMWERRFAPRTPVADLYLCGAATHPGGSVIAVNGRNAAMAVLADLRRRPPRLEK